MVEIESFTTWYALRGGVCDLRTFSLGKLGELPAGEGEWSRLGGNGRPVGDRTCMKGDALRGGVRETMVLGVDVKSTGRILEGEGVEY